MLLRRFVVLASIALGSSLAHSAPDKVCFRDVREFEAVRDRLPASLRGGSLYAVHKSFSMRGGFRVFQAGSRFVIEAKGRSMLGQRINEDENIKLACVQGSTLKVWLDDGRHDEIGIEPTGFRFHGFLFRIATAEVYAHAIR
ncbi:MAG: hypothetical protein V4760_14910 [Bdellovibrionota bacterium]